MEQINFNFNYRGAAIAATICPDENFLGMTYPVEFDGQYSFTLYCNDEEQWAVMRENDGNVPDVDMEILRKVVKQIEWQMQYAA